MLLAFSRRSNRFDHKMVGDIDGQQGSFQSTFPPKEGVAQQAFSVYCNVITLGGPKKQFPLPQTSKFQSVTNQQKTNKKNTFSSTAGARPTIPTILGMVIEEVSAIFLPPPLQLFFDPISSLPLVAIENISI